MYILILRINMLEFMRKGLNVMSLLGDREVPEGLAMALAQNLDAMAKFAGMSRQEQDSFIDKSQTVSSKSEMERLVSLLDEQSPRFI